MRTRLHRPDHDGGQCASRSDTERTMPSYRIAVLSARSFVLIRSGEDVNAPTMRFPNISIVSIVGAPDESSAMSAAQTWGHRWCDSSIDFAVSWRRAFVDTAGWRRQRQRQWCAGRNRRVTCGRLGFERRGEWE